jgi:hypothetical protein
LRSEQRFPEKIATHEPEKRRRSFSSCIGPQGTLMMEGEVLQPKIKQKRQGGSKGSSKKNKIFEQLEGILYFWQVQQIAL